MTEYAEDGFAITPPNDQDAERATLSAMMLCGDDRETFAGIRQHLFDRAFYSSDNQVIFTALCAMHDRGNPVDAITLRAELSKRGKYEEIGGADYLARVMTSLPSASAGEHYAKIVSTRARERAAYATANALAQTMLKPNDIGSTEAIEAAIERLWKIVSIGRPMQIWRLEEAIDRFILQRKDGAGGSCLETGIGEIDRDYRGVFRLGGYTLVAARPSMGKSTWIRDRLRKLAAAGMAVGLISVEETQDKIACNQLSATTMIENAAVDSGRWRDDTRDALEAARDEIAKHNFYGIDSVSTLADVITAAQIMVTRHRCQIIGIDHIHLISGAASRENRNQQLGEISAAIKAMIKRLNICGIVAAQLSRPERVKVPDPPTLTDLRDSGSLEEHADAVLMLHREDYYHRGEDGYSSDDLCHVLIRKNRNGCVGTVMMKADLAHQRFEEVDGVPEQVATMFQTTM